jgi:hypothetical protein
VDSAATDISPEVGDMEGASRGGVGLAT